MIGFQVTPVSQPPSPIDDAVNDLLMGIDAAAVEPAILPSVITRLGAIRDGELHRANIDEAEYADQVMIRAEARLKVALRDAAQRDIEQKYTQRLDQAEEDLRLLTEHVHEMFARLQAGEDEEEERLRTRHRQEIDSFVRRWDSPSVLRRFTRASPTLQACRRQTATLYEQRRYDDLRANSVEIRHREQKERNDNYRNMAMTYEAQLLILEERHTKELEVLRVAREGREKTFLAAAAIDIEHASRRVAGLEVTVKGVANPDRVWNLHHRFDRKPVGPSPPPTRFAKTAVPPAEITTLQLPPLATRRRSSHRGSRRRSQIPVEVTEDGDILT
jgi:hypothetical protein